MTTTELEQALRALQVQLSQARLQSLCMRLQPRICPYTERAAHLVRSPYYDHGAASAALDDAEAAFWRDTR